MNTLQSKAGIPQNACAVGFQNCYHSVTAVYLPFLPFLDDSGLGSYFSQLTEGTEGTDCLVHEVSTTRGATSGPDEEMLNLEHDAMTEWGHLGYCPWGGVSHSVYGRERELSIW